MCAPNAESLHQVAVTDLRRHRARSVPRLMGSLIRSRIEDAQGFGYRRTAKATHEPRITEAAYLIRIGSEPDPFGVHSTIGLGIFSIIGSSIP